MSIYHHKTLSKNIPAILRSGLSPSKHGTYGSGVYLIPPQTDPDDFHVVWHRGKDVSTLAVGLKRKPRLLRVEHTAPNYPLHVLRLLHGHEAGNAAYDKLGIMHLSGGNILKPTFQPLNTLVAEAGYDGIEDGREILLFDGSLVKKLTQADVKKGWLDRVSAKHGTLR